MPYIPEISKLNASTMDILNVIRANASYEYQSLVPEVTTTTDIPAVGDIIMGYPALANQFINSLINRIALVSVKTASFYNDFQELKKGYLRNGETVEEVFVNIAKAREFNVEKAEGREFKRTLPDVRTAFHVINWRVQYPVTIQDQDLRQAFTSVEGVQDLIAKIVDSIYRGESYDEYLLFKYLLIKAVNKGVASNIAISDYTGNDILHRAASAFRALSNRFTLMSKDFNASGVHTVTSRDDQFIFMDASFNAEFDVNVLASAFNMDRADFIGRLKLVDDWATFDNERFLEIADNSNMIELVTEDELEKMQDVKAILVDREFFQVYDNLVMFTEKYVSSGMYWNYFFNVWKTISYSPFSNIVVFKTSSDNDLSELTVEIVGKDTSEFATVFELSVSDAPGNYEFVQTEEMTSDGTAMHRWGGLIIPATNSEKNYGIEVKNVNTNTFYKASTQLNSATEVGDTLTLSKQTIN